MTDDVCELYSDMLFRGGTELMSKKEGTLSKEKKQQSE